MKKIIGLIFIFFFSSRTYAQGFQGDLPPNLDSFPYRIMENGSYISDQADIEVLDDGNYLYPLRFILENNHYQLDWHKGIIDITKGDFKTSLKLADTKYSYRNNNGSILIDQAYFKNFRELELNMDRPNKTLIIQAPLEANDILSYDLGSRSFKTSTGALIDYQLQGAITSRLESKKPVVFILHGSHSIVDPTRDRYDLGFSYLMKYLAQDYIVLSLNVNPNFSYIGSEPYMDERLVDIFKETLLALTRANQGDLAFGLDLRDKLDLDNSFLIGHSRSGQAIFQLADIYQDSDLIKLRGLLAYGPAQVFARDYPLADLPTSIVLPELDGDVSSQDGQDIFDNILEEEYRKSQAQLVYLYGANHNSINQAILNQDEGLPWLEREKEKISALEERDFVKRYSLDFLNTIYRKQDPFLGMQGYQGNLLGYRALVSTYEPGGKYFSADKPEDLKILKPDKSKYSLLNQSFIPDLNSAGLFNHPVSRESYPILKIDWTRPSASLVFDKPYRSSGTSSLNLYLAQDSTSQLNKEANQAFTIRLFDKDNNLAILRLDKDTPALWYSPGDRIFDDTSYSNNTPLSILKLDLSQLKDFDRDNISRVEFLFDQNPTGSLILKYMYFR